MEEPRARFENELRLELPNHALFIGASQSGKTRLCLHLLNNPHLFSPKPARILFYYDQFQESYFETKQKLSKLNITLLLYKGLAELDLDMLEKYADQTIILIDDFSEETSSSSKIARIATNGRHKNYSLWLIWHQLYSKHAASRTIAQNIRYYFFLPSLRLESQLRTFGSQLGMKNQLLSAFRNCVDDLSESYRYLLVDLGPLTPTILRLRTGIHNVNVQHCFI